VARLRAKRGTRRALRHRLPSAAESAITGKVKTYPMMLWD
jgi:hypothetical protein